MRVLYTVRLGSVCSVCVCVCVCVCVTVDSLLSDDVAVLHRAAAHPGHLHVPHHVSEGQAQVLTMDGYPRAPLRRSRYGSHLQGTGGRRSEGHRSLSRKRSAKNWNLRSSD